MNPSELLNENGKIDARQTNTGKSDNKITAEECAALRRKFNGHHGAKEYAHNNGLARRTITKHLKGECNCVNSEPELTHSNRFGWVSYDPLDDARNLWNEYRTKSMQEIADKYGVHRTTIRHALEKHDIQ